MTSPKQTLILVAMASQAFVVCNDLTGRGGEEGASARDVERAPAATAEPKAAPSAKPFVACYER